MTVNGVDQSPAAAQAQAAYSQPAHAPNTGENQPAGSTNNRTEQTQQQQQTQVYFFEANLGRNVNILV